MWRHAEAILQGPVVLEPTFAAYHLDYSVVHTPRPRFPSLRPSPPPSGVRALSLARSLFIALALSRSSSLSLLNPKPKSQYRLRQKGIVTTEPTLRSRIVTTPSLTPSTLLAARRSLNPSTQLNLEPYILMLCWLPCGACVRVCGCRLRKCTAAH
jgi:hypothetical protein